MNNTQTLTGKLDLAPTVRNPRLFDLANRVGRDRTRARTEGSRNQ